MSKKYEKWVIQLLDDFWVSFYPGVPRHGNATESKCRTIEGEIEKNISSSSLYNYFNEKSSPPTDSTKGIMSYYILSQWKEQAPEKFNHLQINGADLNLKDAPNKYLMMYRRIKAVQNNPQEIKVEEENTKFVNISLLDSKSIKGILLASAIFIIGLLYYLPINSIINKFKPTPERINDEIESVNNLFFISIMHVFTVTLLLIIFHMPFGGKNQIRDLPNSYAKASLLQFEKGWIALWISWICLYTWLSIKWFYEHHLLEKGKIENFYHFQQLSWAVADVVNIFSTFCFFYLFFILDMKTLKAEGNETTTSSVFYRSASTVMIIAVALLALTITDRFVDFGNWDGAGTLVYSLFTSLAMLYFFGRLDSHFFKAHRILLAPLYLYSVIQVNWNNMPFAEFASQGLVIFFVAFLLKIYLFFIINGWIRNGDFGKYFQQMRVLHQAN